MRTLSELFTAFSDERTRYRDPDIRATIDRLESAAEAAMYKENEVGGEARQVVGDVAVALGVVLGDTGPRMSVWDPANMRRVVHAARMLREERDGYRAALVERERNEHRKAAEEAEAKLRKQEYGCETPESHNYGCPCDKPIKFRGGSITLHPDPMTAELRFDAGPWSSTAMLVEEVDPAPVRQVGVRIDGQVWSEFLRAAAAVDPGSKALRERLAELETSAEYWGANAPGGSLIDDLKNTIVSQAREIARLKGRAHE